MAEQMSFLEDDDFQRSNQGQGETTEFKQRGIQAAITINLRALLKYQSYGYFYLDCNSGSGTNKQAGCIGSPRAALAAFKETGWEKYHAVFCDSDKAAIEELNACPEIIADHRRSYLFHGDNREVIPVFEKIIASKDRLQFANACVLLDPNGWAYGDACPLEELQSFCHKVRKADLILNLNVRTYQMMLPHVTGVTKNGKPVKRWSEDKTLLRVSEFPRFFDRTHWLIRNVIQKKGDRFVLLVGRNYHIGDHQSIGMHHLESDRGAAIVDEIERGRCTSRVIPITDTTGSFGLCEG